MTNAAAAQSARSSPLAVSLFGALILGFTDIIFSVSLASLVFSGSLREYLPRGIAIMLVTEAITMIIGVIWISKGGVVTSIQQNPAVILAVTVPAIAAATIAAGGNVIATVIAVIVLTTIVTGGLLVMLGTFRLGQLVHYVPYPVIGGFLAGAGWLVTKGALGTMVDNPLALETIPDLFGAQQFLLWFPGVVFGLILFFSSQKIDHPLVFPVLFISGLILFFIALAITGTSVEVATGQGLLVGDVGNTAVWNPLPLSDLTQADWGVVVNQAGNIGSIILITGAEMLLNIAGIELLLRKEIDLNYTLRLTGLGNILSGLGGGWIGYPDLSLSTLNYQVRGQARITSLITFGMCVLLLIAGVSILAYTPKLLIGGLLFYMGLVFLNQWVYETWKKLSRRDYAVIVGIALIVATYGFLQGVAVGLILMIVMFVVDYSQINIFRHVLSGAEKSSHVERNAYYKRVLTDLGKKIYILELQNFIFFGTANAVLEDIRKRLTDEDQAPLKYLVLDFRHVTGLDASAVLSLIKAKYLAEASRFVMILTHLSAEIERDLSRNRLVTDATLMIFPDLDRALEWCENQLLQKERITVLHMPANLQLQLADMGFSKDYTNRLRKYLQLCMFNEGDILIKQGDESSDLYFVEIGEVSLFLDVGAEKRVRLNTLSMGTIVGELGFILETPRTAWVIADLNTIAYRLTREKMEAMKTEEPDLAIAFNEMLLRLISQRMTSSVQELAALNRQ